MVAFYDLFNIKMTKNSCLIIHLSFYQNVALEVSPVNDSVDSSYSFDFKQSNKYEIQAG